MRTGQPNTRASASDAPRFGRGALRFAAGTIVVLTAGACASAGGSSLPAPSLTGEYELIGPLTHDDTAPESPIVVVFLPDQMVQSWRELDVGRPDPPRRYRVSGNRVTFSIGGVEIRVGRDGEGGLRASAHGTYGAQGRPYQTCVIWSAIDGAGQRRCMQEETRYRTVQRRYERPVTFTRRPPSG